jgi:hypothetical protein
MKIAPYFTSDETNAEAFKVPRELDVRVEGLLASIE